MPFPQQSLQLLRFGFLTNPLTAGPREQRLRGSVPAQLQVLVPELTLHGDSRGRHGGSGLCGPRLGGPLYFLL